MSNDVKSIAFVETGESAGNAYGVFVRPTGGGPRRASGRRRHQRNLSRSRHRISQAWSASSTS